MRRTTTASLLFILLLGLPCSAYAIKGLRLGLSGSTIGLTSIGLHSNDYDLRAGLFSQSLGEEPGLALQLGLKNNIAKRSRWILGLFGKTKLDSYETVGLYAGIEHELVRDKLLLYVRGEPLGFEWDSRPPRYKTSWRLLDDYCAGFTYLFRWSR